MKNTSSVNKDFLFIYSANEQEKWRSQNILAAWTTPYPEVTQHACFTGKLAGSSLNIVLGGYIVNNVFYIFKQ